MHRESSLRNIFISSQLSIKRGVAAVGVNVLVVVIGRAYIVKHKQ